MQEIVLKNNNSEHFTLISYPDGQHSIKLNLNKLNIKESVSIKCRIRNFGELEILLCLVTALRKYDFYVESIDFIYLFGMRSDRAFEIGEPNYFRDVLSPIINLLESNIFIFSPHNVCEMNYINASPVYNFYDENLVNFDGLLIGGDSSSNFCNLDNYFIKERKERIIVKLDREITKDFEKIYIVDDLCDGGATFMAEGEYLKRLYPNKKLILFVYHGLFTQGIHPLLTYFDEIICTNSYQDIDHPKVTQIKVI